MNELSLIVGGTVLVYGGWRLLEPAGVQMATPMSEKWDILLGFTLFVLGILTFGTGLSGALWRAIVWHLR